jgi:HlyD family secretion protein
MSNDATPTPPANASETTDMDAFLGTKPPKPWRKWVIRGVIGLVLLALILLVSRCFTASEEPSYATRAARRGDLTVSVSATGNLKPINQVDVGSEQSGKITAVYVDVNDRVTRGQKLAELDTRRLVDTIDQNRAQVASSQAGVAQAQAQAALAKATLDRQLNVFQLSGGKVPAKTELDAARANYQSALATLNSSRAQVRVAQAQLSTAQTNLSIAQIVSPVTGVVLSRDIEPGQTVAASLNAPVLFTIAEDLTQMEVEVSVDEADVGQVKNGQSASFSVDAFPGRTFPATITRVNVGSNASSTSSSSTSSTTSSTSGTVVAYTAVLAVNNADETLRPGMTATADIITQELKDVLLVPNSALRFKPSSGAASGSGITGTLMPRRRGGGGNTRQVSFGAGSSQTVYIVGEDGKPKAVQVTVGASDGSRTVITGGDLKEGARVITGQLAAGQQQPADDQSDQPRGKDRGAAPAASGNASGTRPTDGSPATMKTLGNSAGSPAETAPVAPTSPAPNSGTERAGEQRRGRAGGGE